MNKENKNNERRPIGFISINALNEVQLIDIEKRIDALVRDLFNEWARGQDDLFHKQRKRNEEVENKRRDEHFDFSKKHAKQIEKYLDGFNKLLSKKL